MSTFYPPNSDTPEVQTFVHMTSYVSMSDVDKGFQYIKAGKKTIVVKNWKQISFIGICEISSPYLVLFQLQTVRNIAIFLFGPDFEQYMLGDISMKACEIFGNYVDLFKKLLEQNSIYLFGAVPHFPTSTYLSDILDKTVSVTDIPEDLGFVICYVFKNHKVIGIHANRGLPMLGSADILMLHLIENIEYPEITEDSPASIDPNYITQVQSKIKYKSGYLQLDGTYKRCVISMTQLNENSALTVLCVTSSPNVNDQKELIMNLLSCFAANVQAGMNPPQRNFQNPPAAVAYLAIGRTTGETFEETTIGNERSMRVLQGLYKVLAERAFEALSRGLLVHFWNDGLFHFCYEMIFEDENGEIVVPSTAVRPGASLFVDGRVLSYSTLASELFGPGKAVNVFEVYSIYFATSMPADILTSNRYIFEEVVRMQSVLARNKNKEKASTKRSKSASTIGLQMTRKSSVPNFLPEKHGAFYQPQPNSRRPPSIPKKPH